MYSAVAKSHTWTATPKPGSMTNKQKSTHAVQDTQLFSLQINEVWCYFMNSRQ